jgi:hypothetical protein
VTGTLLVSRRANECVEGTLLRDWDAVGIAQGEWGAWRGRVCVTGTLLVSRRVKGLRGGDAFA